MDQPGTQPVHPLLAVGLSTFEAALQLILQVVQAGQQAFPVGTDQFGGGGWRWGAEVGSKIGNGEIGFVADASDDRNG